MSSSHVERAQVLAEALPYIQKYYGKTIVVKYGGNAMISEELRRAVISDIILLHLVGIRVVVVHGGGPEITEMLKQLGQARPNLWTACATPTQETMDVVQQVLCGKVNKDLVATLNRMGGRAIGPVRHGRRRCSRPDSWMRNTAWWGRWSRWTPPSSTTAWRWATSPWSPPWPREWTGRPPTTSTPTPPRPSWRWPSDAEKLILLTDVRGLLRDPKDEDTLIPRWGSSPRVPGLVKDGVIQGGMIPKVDCCVEAVRSGVKNTIILDGRIPHSILIELLSDSGHRHHAAVR